MIGAAHHHRRAVPRAFFTTRDTQTHKVQIVFGQTRRTGAGGMEIGVARIDHGVARI